jgi:hypothetical protein
MNFAGIMQRAPESAILMLLKTFDVHIGNLEPEKVNSK